MAQPELALRRIGAVAVALVAVIVLVVVVAFALLDAWHAPKGGADASDTERDARSLPSAPQLDLRVHRAAERARLDSLGWVDRGRGIAHIPIDEAGKLLQEEKGEGGREKGNRPEASTPSPLTLHPSRAAAKLPLGAASAPPPVDFVQRIGARLPLDLPVLDARGHSTRLGAQFTGSRPVLLVLGYYTCPNLCGIAMHGLIEALHATALPVDDYRIVGVSVDPQDTPASARARADAYGGYARFVFGERNAPSSHLLVADAGGIDALTARVGFVSMRTPDAPASSPIAHPTGVVVVTPEGTVSRYLFGVRFDANELRLALVEASAGRIGGLSDRVRLLCAHFDPAIGLHSEAAMNAARVTGLLTVLLLGGWILRRLRGGDRR
ncbi:MAG: SCO family protein [Burkholderiaceae bacterium]|nr:SCO family protein [Burkholderiaceae bacterium]